MDELSIRDGRYDGVLHLVTAACGAEDHYSLDNNEARSESVEVARDVRGHGLPADYLGIVVQGWGGGEEGQLLIDTPPNHVLISYAEMASGGVKRRC